MYLIKLNVILFHILFDLLRRKNINNLIQILYVYIITLEYNNVCIMSTFIIVGVLLAK